MKAFCKVALVAGLHLAGAGFVNAAVTDIAQAPLSTLRDPTTGAQKRFDTLSKKLELTPAQQPAWTKYRSAMLRLAQERVQEMERWKKADHAEQEDISTSERLERMAARIRTGAERLSKVATDTRTFYTELSTEQKTIFDLYAANQWRSRMSMMRSRHH